MLCYIPREYMYLDIWHVFFTIWGFTAHVGKHVVGAKAIAEALKVNAVMKNLSVAYNSNIVGEAAQQLAAAALGPPSLPPSRHLPPSLPTWGQPGEVY